MNKFIGQPVSRLEGALKVTGTAKYSGDYNVPDLLHGYVVNSTITKGKILKIDITEAMRLKGVVEIFSHENHPPFASMDFRYADMDAPPGSVFKPFKDAEIKYNGQPIALVVAESFELARYAASIVNISYMEESYTTDLLNNLNQAKKPKTGLATAMKPPPPKPKGDFEKAYAHSFAQASGEFIHGAEHHNPLELFATTTVYEGEGKLTIYDKTQGTVNSQLYVGNVFGLHFKDVQVKAPYVGGGFGSGLRPQYQLFMSVMAALKLKRNVRVTLDRSQMFTFGHRPPTLQRTRFGADENGNVTALAHAAFAETSRFEDYTESVVHFTNMLYPAENTLLEYKLVHLDVYSPLDMRAPGGSTGMHAVESTMDELSYKLKMDPVELRLKNYAATDAAAGKPFSSKELKQCFLQGAEKFGWSQRNPEPRSMRRGNRLVGYGMATGVWEAITLPSLAQAVLTKEGRLEVNSAITDIGTGTLTVMTQIAADELGLCMDDVTFTYGDSKLTFAPVQGGSFTVSSIGSAVKAAVKELGKKIFKLAKKMDNSPFKNTVYKNVRFADGNIYSTDTNEAVSIKDIAAANRSNPIKVKKFSVPDFLRVRKYTKASHSAVFVEVEVDEELGVINVTRALTAVAAGRIINPKTARSQILGGMIWGISKVLREETISDHRLGKYINTNLAEYHIPVHADIHELEAIFVEEKDDIVNELGSKGIGEIGLVGMPPAIANAIYHATGKRMNTFPIHFELLTV